MIATIFGTVGLAGLFTLYMPRRYESRMKLLVKNDRADLVITADKDSQSQRPSEISETQVNSEMELLHSRDILEGIVNDAKLYRGFQKDPKARPTRLSIDRAVVSLERGLTIAGLRKTNLIQVSYRSIDPNVASFILHDLGDRYLSEHVAIHSAHGSFRFFADQVDKYQSQLAEARSQLNQFHQKNQLFNMPQQQAAVVGHLQQTQAELKDVDTQMKEQMSRLEEGQRQFSATPERVVTQIHQVPKQTAIERLQTTLNELENRRISLAMKYNKGDRMIDEMDQEIANTNQTLTKLSEANFNQQTTDVNTIHQALLSEFVNTRIALAGLRSRHKSLAENAIAYSTQLNEMDRDYLDLASVEARQKQAEENFLFYSRRLEESRLADSLDRERFANVAIVEQPVSSPIPVSPKLSTNLALGGILGLMLAFALAFVVDTFSKNKRGPEPAFQRPLYAPRNVTATASGD